MLHIRNCTLIYKSTFNVIGFKNANTFTDSTNYAKFYLGYLEKSLVRHMGEMQDLMGPACSDFTFPNMICLEYHLMPILGTCRC